MHLNFIPQSAQSHPLRLDSKRLADSILVTLFILLFGNLLSTALRISLSTADFSVQPFLLVGLVVLAVGMGWLARRAGYDLHSKSLAIVYFSLAFIAGLLHIYTSSKLGLQAWRGMPSYPILLGINWALCGWVRHQNLRRGLRMATLVSGLVYVVGLLAVTLPFQPTDALMIYRYLSRSLVVLLLIVVVSRSIAQQHSEQEMQLHVTRFGLLASALYFMLEGLAAPFLLAHSPRQANPMSITPYVSVVLLAIYLAGRVFFERHLATTATLVNLIFVIVAASNGGQAAGPGIVFSAFCVALIAPRRLRYWFWWFGLMILGSMWTMSSFTDPLALAQTQVIAIMAAAVPVYWRSVLFGVNLSPVDQVVQTGVRRLGNSHDRLALLSGAGASLLAVLVVFAFGLQHANEDQRDARVALTQQQREIIDNVAKIASLSEVMAFALAREASYRNPTPDTLQSLKEQFFRGDLKGINLQWAPQGVVSMMSDLPGNEAALGHNLLQDPQHKEAIQQLVKGRSPRWFGPYELKQGGMGLIYRLPVYATQEPGAAFKGLAVVVVKFPEAIGSILVTSIDSAHVHNSGHDFVQLNLGTAFDAMTPVWTAHTYSESDHRVSSLLVSMKNFENQTRLSVWEPMNLPDRLRIEVRMKEPPLWNFDHVVFLSQLAVLCAALSGVLTYFSIRNRLANKEQTRLLSLMSVIDRMLSATLVIDSNGKTTFVNDTYVQTLGVSREEAYKTNYIEMPYWIDLGCSDMFRLTLEDGVERSKELSLTLNPGGRSLDLKVHVSRTEFDHKPHILVQILDLTESNMVRAEIISQQHKFSQSMSDAGLGYFEVGFDGRLDWWSARSWAIFGYPDHPDGFTPSANFWVEKVHPEDFAAFNRARIDPQVPNPHRGRYRFLHTDGTFHVAESTAYRTFSATGAVLATTGFERDITDLVAQEEQLQLTTSKLETIFQHAMVCLAIFQGRTIHWCNEGILELLGYTPEEVQGKSTRILFGTEEEWVELGKRTYAAHSAGLPFTEEIQLRSKDGRVVWVNLSMRLVEHKVQTPQAVAVLFDITKRKQLEENMDRALRAANASEEAKSRFIANISHEIRTPLNAVIGYGHILDNSPLDASQRETLGKLNQSGQLMLSLINNVLDLMRSEAGQLQLANEPLHLRDVLNQVEQVMLGQATAKQLLLSVAPLPRSLDRYWMGDKVRLSQILINLVGNAIKFTSTGQVNLRVLDLDFARPSGDGTHHVAFVVKDSGIGMSESDLDKLFKRFSQIDDGSNRRYQGTGLGLAISKDLAEAMGGRIEVRSTLGQGSIFTVKLALRAADDAAMPHTPSPIGIQHQQTPVRQKGMRRLQNLHILVVDDNMMNLDVAQALLSSEGAQVHMAGNGQLAVDFLYQREALNEAPVDVVLMDVQMPILDGHDATRLMRLNPQWADLPVIAVTASSSEEDKRLAMASGMNDYVSKPYDLERLVEAIGKHVAHRAGNFHDLGGGI